MDKIKNERQLRLATKLETEAVWTNSEEGQWTSWTKDAEY